MAKTAFRAQLERLELRETPAAFTGIHALAGSTVALQGAGTGQVTSETSIENSLAITATLIGHDKRAGAFTGQVGGQIFLSKPTSQATGTATLTVGSGATVDLLLTGDVHMKNGSSVATGTFHFKVTGGTGLFEGATGSGNGTGSINETSGAVTFKYMGKGHL